MALNSAHGGHVVLKPAGTPVIVPNERWSGDWQARDTEVTQSDSGGGTLFFPVVQNNEWEFSAARDDVNYPQAIGLAQGTIVPLIYFKLGADIPGGTPVISKGDKLANTTVTSVATVNDNKGDVVRVTVRGHGGVLTPNQTIPLT